jgi:hypothetical protein
MSYPWIRASEIGEYVYCRRAWWLKRVKGLQSGHVRQLDDGRRYHEKHGAKVRTHSWMRKLAYVFIFLVVSIVVFQLIVQGL